jgi:L-rhamnose isomerase
MKEAQILKAYEIAKERYAAIGVDTDKAVEILENTPISLHCWQTDDVIGFERDTGLSGGIQTTGNYPGRARNIDELRQDILAAKRLIPGLTGNLSPTRRSCPASTIPSRTATRRSWTCSRASRRSRSRNST